MEDRSRKALYFFVGIIIPLIMIVVGVVPNVGNILLTIIGMVWLGFSILLVSPAKD